MPKFSVSRRQPPRYVLVLENSAAMDGSGGRWELLSMAAKKFVREDLQNSSSLGLVLFNEEAHEAKAVQVLEDAKTRDSVTVKIPNRYGLINKTSSCIKCGVREAIKALQVRPKDIFLPSFI